MKSDENFILLLSLTLGFSTSIMAAKVIIENPYTLILGFLLFLFGMTLYRILILDEVRLGKGS